MENKLNQPALEQYAAKYSDLLINKLYSDKNLISGKEIINKIPVKQVGFFVLFNLFKAWKEEMGQLKSPYFDFENEEVKLKLTEFMNLLSKNISVAQSDFAPLLGKAVEDALLVIISPLEYYQNLVASFNGNAPTMEEVQDLQRFIKTNTHMRDALLTAWATNYTAKELFDKAFEGLTEPPQEVKPLIAPFNELLKLDVNSFLIEENEPTVEPVIIEEVTPDLIEEEENASLTGDVLLSEEKEEVEIETIHTQFSEEKTNMLADSLGFEATSTLKSMLTINQKFMFINDLFDGNNEDFNKVIDFLDSCETKEVVVKFINSNYIQRGSWKAEAPQVKEFLSLIDKKFN